MEKLDLKNVLEVENIKTILSNHENLLEIFEMILIIANKQLESEKTALKMEIEPNIDPVLSDHESDED